MFIFLVILKKEEGKLADKADAALLGENCVCPLPRDGVVAGTELLCRGALLPWLNKNISY